MCVVNVCQIKFVLPWITVLFRRRTFRHFPFEVSIYIIVFRVSPICANRFRARVDELSLYFTTRTISNEENKLCSFLFFYYSTRANGALYRTLNTFLPTMRVEGEQYLRSLHRRNKGVVVFSVTSVCYSIRIRHTFHNLNALFTFASNVIVFTSGVKLINAKRQSRAIGGGRGQSARILRRHQIVHRKDSITPIRRIVFFKKYQYNTI